MSRPHHPQTNDALKDFYTYWMGRIKDGKFNGGIWLLLEDKVRYWSKKTGASKNEIVNVALEQYMSDE